MCCSNLFTISDCSSEHNDNSGNSEDPAWDHEIQNRLAEEHVTGELTNQNTQQLRSTNDIAAFQKGERQPRPHCSIRDVCGQQNVAIKIHTDQCWRHVHHQKCRQHGTSQVSQLLQTQHDQS